MTRYLGPKDGNKNGEQSFIQFVSSLFSGQVAAGLTVTQQSTPTIGVSVAPGTAAIPTGNGYPYTIWSTAIENVTLNTADGSNPRIDLIIAYIDLSIANSSSSNSPSGWSLLKVTGTPSGSPVVPNTSAIQSALPNSSYPYIILAQVAVAAGATTITNANITDVRTWAQLSSANINFGGSGAGLWWQEIAYASLGSAGNTITVSNIPACKYLMAEISVLNTGGTIDPTLRFNNDSGNTYTLRVNDNGGGDATAGSQSSITLDVGGPGAYPHYSILEIINIINQEKLVFGKTIAQGALGSGNLPGRRVMSDKWVNTSSQINRIDVINTGAGNFASGSEIRILGHN